MYQQVCGGVFYASAVIIAGQATVRGSARSMAFEVTAVKK
jgi:hypothetical protein